MSPETIAALDYISPLFFGAIVLGLFLWITRGKSR